MDTDVHDRPEKTDGLEALSLRAIRVADRPVFRYALPPARGSLRRTGPMHPMVNIAVRAARAAGAIIVRYMDRVDTIPVTSKDRNDFVTEVDRAAEREIVRIVRRAYPGHGIMAEEGARRAGDEYEWVIDPLDGTTNYLHGFPFFAVSIGILRRGRPEHAVVYDPLRQEIFTASRGAGATLNDRRIRVRKARSLEGALLGTGFPPRIGPHLDSYLAMFRSLFQDTAGIRRAGSAALDLAYVAAGRLDGFWEMGLKPWDMAAGALLVQEAGGIVTDLRGGERYLETGHILAATPRVHREMARLVAPHVPPAQDKPAAGTGSATI